MSIFGFKFNATKVKMKDILFKTRVSVYYMIIYIIKLCLIAFFFYYIIKFFILNSRPEIYESASQVGQVILAITFIGYVYFLKSFLTRSLKTIVVYEDFYQVNYFFLFSTKMNYEDIIRIYFTRDTIEGEGGGYGESEFNIELKDLSSFMIKESEIVDFDLFTSEFIDVLKSNRQRRLVEIQN